MARNRFQNQPLVQLPAGALAALVRIAETFVDGAPDEDYFQDVIKEANACATTQGVDLEGLVDQEKVYAL